MNIRESVKNDNDSILEVHQNAFGEIEGKTISRLVIGLLEDKEATPALSLVAEQDGKIVGSIIFSAITVVTSKTMSAYILAPLAVVKPVQGSGIGTALINQGLQALKEHGAEFVMVYGDPDYYSRTGFNINHSLKPPYELTHPDAWMAQVLLAGALTNLQGTVRCAEPLMAPEHW